MKKHGGEHALLAAAGLIETAERMKPAPVMDDFIREKLFGADSHRTVIAASLSGGKDGLTAAAEIKRELDAGNFRGKFVAIHSDLGLIEHAESLGECEKLARHLGCELIVVKPRLEFLARVEKRWLDNKQRFELLERVRLTTPFPYAGNGRYCTSELKVAPVTQELKKRYPEHFIVNVVGLRGEESPDRAAKPLWEENKRLRGVRSATDGVDYYPVLRYLIGDVWDVHEREGLARHPAYVRGNSRVSCSYCFLASTNDLKVSLRDERTHESFHRLVAIELASSFSYRSSSFLASVGYDYLSEAEKAAFADCLRKQQKRVEIEKRIPAELLFVDDFPNRQATVEESAALAEVRAEIGELLGLEMSYVTGRAVYERYAELLVNKEAKKAAKAAEEARREARLIAAAAKVLKETAAAKTTGIAAPVAGAAIKKAGAKKASAKAAPVAAATLAGQGSLFAGAV